MIRAVLDTNVLVSGIVGFALLASTPGRLLRAWRAGEYELIVSQHIFLEVARTLQKPYFRQRLSVEQIARATQLLARRATLTPLTVQVSGVAAHPEDDLVLSTALSANADYLVTGDGALQRLGLYQSLTILSPAAFLAVLQPTMG
jgi:uncharacterized protein